MTNPATGVTMPTDPLAALRQPVSAVEPRAEFVAALRARLETSLRPPPDVPIIDLGIKYPVAALNEPRTDAGRNRAADGSQINAKRVKHVVRGNEDVGGGVVQTDDRRGRQGPYALVIGIEELPEQLHFFSVQIVFARGEYLPAILRLDRMRSKQGCVQLRVSNRRQSSSP